MYSKILFKLIQESIIPAFGLTVIKILATIYYGRVIGYSVDLYNVFNLQVSFGDYQLINSNILLSFMLFTFLGLSYCLVKSLFFHSSHIAPRISLGVFNFRVGFLIQDSFHLFSQTLIWLIFNFTVLFLALFLYIFGLVYGYIVLISSILVLISLYLFILDIEFEYNKISMEEEDEVFVA